MQFPVELPEDFVRKALSLGVKPEDLVEQFIRGGGKGGQKINKTSSCVLLRHLPTGIEVRCQFHREQSKNRLSAYKLIINKIEEQILGARSQKVREIFKLRKQKKKRSRRAKEKMLEMKRERGEVKELRRKVL